MKVRWRATIDLSLGSCMVYRRFESNVQLSKDQKRKLLREYYDYYHRLYEKEPESLNIKVPREAFASLLDQIGEALLINSAEMSRSGEIHEFLQANPLPESLDGLIPDEFRAFSLVLNALKQWVSAEQAATDRYLLGGTARQTCKEAATTCVVTGNSLEGQTVELHHPMRDGRPPLPVSKEGHAKIEGQVPSADDDSILTNLKILKRAGNRSWVQLRLGCQTLLGQEISQSNKSVIASSKTFARKAQDLTGMSYLQLIRFLDEHGF